MTDWGTIGISGAAVVVGAVVGGRATLRAARQSFERQRESEASTWRRALYHECVTNIRLMQTTEGDPQAAWSFELRVLDEMPLHADALNAEQLERVIRIRVLNVKLERVLDTFRAHAMPGALAFSATPASVALAPMHARIAELRHSIDGELSILEASLRE